MSTYSPSLRIELITTGDQAGTWGGTTNTNLGTLIESAIAGYTSVSITSANQALTALNGAADQSRNMTLALTTTTTANFAVYAPPAEKTYIVYNASSYAATLYNSTVLGNTTAAGAGVVIPAGKTTTVWSDGTNFALQNTYVPPVAFADIANALYPVGSIYTNATNNTNPATLLGVGTWVAFGAGRVPVGFNAADPLFDTAEETGGSKDATLVSHTHTGATGDQNQSHTHYISGATGNAGGHNHTVTLNNTTSTGSSEAVAKWSALSAVTATSTATTSTIGDHSHSFSGSTGLTSQGHLHYFTTDASGSSGTNANIQPYITVFMWKRTA